MNQLQINVLFCLDDVKWDYTRHCAVTILSLLETNKNNNIKIYILSSILPQENINELKRIVYSYNQEIEFIIRDDIVPEELKKVIINKNSLTWGVWYRWFFPRFIKWVDRILSLDCDVLVMDDISEIYNMDMHGKSIAGYYDIRPFRCKNKIFWIDNYINAGVLLFDAKKYDVKKINVDIMKEINEKYAQYFHWSDQDKVNIIFKDDIYVYNQSMNYQITSKFFNVWLDKAKIIHCLSKPYIQYNNVPKNLINLYYKYLDKTIWKWYPEKDANYWYFKYLLLCVRSFLSSLLIMLLWDRITWKISIIVHKHLWDVDYRKMIKK